MKKSRLSIALMTGLLSAATLTGCDNLVTYSPTGTLITYSVGDGTKTIKSEDIFAEYYNDSDKYQSIFDAIKSIVVKNYFEFEDEAPNGTPLGLGQVEELEKLAQTDVDSDKHQADLNAQNNNSTYDKEFEKILSSKGVKTEQELYNKYLDQRKVEKFDENYYKYFLDEIKEGSDAVKNNDNSNFWTGYFKDMLPYHVSHILVKLDDSSATNYYNGTISENDCDKLYKVVKTLENTNKDAAVTFQQVASRRSEDDGSKARKGDLGIMDYGTSFVNEFKLGVYAYENYYGKAQAATSNIRIPGKLAEDFKKEIITSYPDSEINNEVYPTVDIKVFEDLYSVRKETQTADEEDVMGGSSLVYPRNLIYNKELNRHSFAFVTTDDTATGYIETESNFYDSNNKLVEGKTGMHKYTTGKLAAINKPILSAVVANEIKPIIMVRAGTSDYQGIHFILVNRDAFTTEDQLGVKMSDYYTTAYITDKSAFPHDSNNNALPTYVNFNSYDSKEINARVDSFRSTLKSYNSDKLNKFIFKKYMAKEGLTIKDTNLKDTLDRWIDNTIQKAEDDKQESWNTTWNDYVSTLRKQNLDRKSLMSQAARLAFEDDIKLTDKLSDTAVQSKVKNHLVSYGFTTTEAEGIINDYKTATSENTESKWVDMNPSGNDWTIADLYNVKGAICNDGKTHK